MVKEIERKFLVTSLDFKAVASVSFLIKQAYISRTPERTVRVRIAGARAYLTVKGKASESGVSRSEWEYQIPLADAQDLLEICEPGIIDKTRYEILFPGSNLKFEVDEFHGKHEGLIIAEIELLHEDQEFPRPAWLGKEVTGDPNYYNAKLSQILL